VLIQVKIGGRRVGVFPVHPAQESERSQSVEKIARRSRMEAQTAAQCLQILGLLSEFREDFDSQSSHLLPLEIEPLHGSSAASIMV
jgi:hypothetical protein